MKKLITIVLLAFILSGCAGKVCGTYSGSQKYNIFGKEKKKRCGPNTKQLNKATQIR